MAQLSERLLPIPEVCGSNPIIGKKLKMNIFTVNIKMAGLSMTIE